MKTNVVIRRMSLLISFVSAFLLNPIYAQNTIGVSAYAGSSNIEVNGLGLLDLLDPYLHSIPQYSVGLDYERGLNPQWSVMTGVHYTTRGFGLREDMNVNILGLDVPVGARINTKLNYVEVPVALQYEFTKQGIKPYVKGGVSAGYAISGKIQPKVQAIINWNLPEIPINLENDLYNRFDLSALVGAGISIPTNDIGSIQFEVSYRHSLNDMFLDNITDIRIKSNGISVGIGYKMRF